MISQLHLFNPGHETALLEDSVHYTPKANIKRMGIDLAALPLWYGESQDFVLVSDEQYNQIIALKESLPIQLPQPVSPNHFPKVLDKQTGKPAPWGMTKGALHQLQCFCELSGYHLQTPNWNPAWKTLTSRTTAAECLNYLQKHFPALKLPFVPQFCQSIKELDDFVEKHQPPFIIKSPDRKSVV